jgi:hypothetical protein
MRFIQETIMFDRLKKHLELKVTEKTEPKEAEVAEETQTRKKPAEKPKKAKKPVKEKLAKAEEDSVPQRPQMRAELNVKEPFVGIEEYSSASEITQKIEKEIAATKSALGEYLRQLDDKRAVAEKVQKLHELVAKIANKKETKENTNQIEVNGLEIFLDATALNELTALESAVKSHQQRLMALQQAQEALKALDEVSDTEGIRYLVFQKEGIPEQVLLKIS